MNITLSTDSPLAAATDLLAIAVSGKRPLQDELVQRIDRAMNGVLVQYMKDEDFKGKEGQTLRADRPRQAQGQARAGGRARRRGAGGAARAAPLRDRGRARGARARRSRSSLRAPTPTRCA